jgi:hypothetical protein
MRMGGNLGATQDNADPAGLAGIDAEYASAGHAAIISSVGTS